MVGLAAISLTFTISGCSGYSKSNDMAVSDALNSDSMLPVVFTDNHSRLGKDRLIWAGYIGDGKIKGIELDNQFPDITYKDLTKLDDKKFGSVVKSLGNEYDENGDLKKNGEFITSKAQTLLVPNEDDEKPKTVLFKLLHNEKNGTYSNLKEVIEGGSYSNPVDKNPDLEWSTIKSKVDTDKSSEYEGYELHIKTTKIRGIKMEESEDYSKKYDNVKIDAYANNW